MNRQDFEREATLRMLATCAANFADPAGAEEFISGTVKLLADRLYAEPSPQLFKHDGDTSAVSNGDRSGITIDELLSRGEIDRKTRNVLNAELRVGHLAELAGARKATVWSYRGIGRKNIHEIDDLLEKYGYERMQ